MTEPGDAPDGRVPDLEPGTRVEVRSDFDGSWSGGFVVDSLADGGYRLRRRSDRELLPVAFRPEDVRRERRSSMWWY